MPARKSQRAPAHLTSPVVATTVTVQGVVVGDYEGSSAATLQGFYLQDSGDGNGATSDGIFLILAYGGAEAYSYVFDGQWGYLDHALASASLAAQVTGAAEWQINADEPSVLDYNTEFKSAGQVSSLYAADPFRIADHDPVLVGLDLGASDTVRRPRACLPLVIR